MNQAKLKSPRRGSIYYVVGQRYTKRWPYFLSLEGDYHIISKSEPIRISLRSSSSYSFMLHHFLE